MANSTLYMIITITEIQQTRIIYIDNNERATDYGKSYKLDYPNEKVIAPPIVGRSFSQFGLLQLQYLYWNTFHLKPGNDYAVLIQDCLEKTQSLKINN